MIDPFAGIEFQTPVDLEKIDIIRCENDDDGHYIRFLKLVEWEHSGIVALVETWTYAKAIERDRTFAMLWPRFMKERYPIDRV